MSTRSKKRARLSETSAEAEPAPKAASPSKENDRHALFTTWAQEQGVEINSVAPQQLPNRGLGLLTTAPVKAGERMLFVPEKAMFKPVPATLKSAGLTQKPSTASPQAQLSLSALAKFSASDASSTSGPGLRTWQATWPTMQDFSASMPLCWPEDLVGQLPPAVLAPLERQKADYARDWEAVKGFCETKGWSEETFKYYWCIVNSRSFHWKPSANRAGSMVLCPFVDYMNHGPTGSGCTVVQTAVGYEVWAARDYDVGEEVLATYGAHSNDKLLVHYGFICDSPLSHASADDEIRLDHVILPHLSDETKSQLQDVGFLGAYALLPSEHPCERQNAKGWAEGCEAKCKQPWEICFKTQVAVRAVLLTANEWEYFVTNGEDLSGDKSAAVHEWLHPLLGELRSETTKKKVLLEEMEGNVDDEHKVAASMLKNRWDQIETHLGLFLDSIAESAK
ncbi:hypothetical protein Q7P37_006450 [Cladosporium fusiforme]